MELKVGDTYKCPEGHDAKVVWISESGETIAVKCSHKHFSKVTKVADHSKPVNSNWRHHTKEKRIFVKNMVFLVGI